MTKTKTKKKTGYLIYNYYKDDMRFRKSKPSKRKTSPHELPIKISFEVKVPKMNIPEISKTIEIPEAKVRETIAELSIEPNTLETDLPEPEHYLANIDAETLKEQLNDKGLGNTLKEEKKDLIKWLRDLYSKELQVYNRETVLSEIENALVKIKQKEEDNR
ncbi:MAG: hypothetical protein ACOCTT_03525 [archaeon]